MQNLPAILTASCLVLGLGFANGSAVGPQDSQEKKPLQSYQAKRQAALEEQLVGTWKLTKYEAPDKIFDGADRLEGWIMIQDGYISWTVYGSEAIQSLFGEDVQANLEAKLFRYRVSRAQNLQMASVLGFSDLDETDGLVFDDGHNAMEYELIIDKRTLTLKDPGAESFTFRRMGTSSFPPRAIRALEANTDFEPLGDD